MRPRSRPLARKVAGVTLGALLLIGTQIGIISAQPGTTDPSESATALLSESEFDALVAEIEHAAQEASAALESLRSDRLQLEAVLDVTPDGPHAILEWLAAETRWVPYMGSLRGATGVLMDRTGSGLDRALLLAELLSAAGYEARLAHARLPRELAEELARRELARPVDADPQQVGDADAVAAHVARVAADAAALTAILAPVGAVGDTEDLAWQRAGEAMAEHWWVQARDGSAWLDLDPVFMEDASSRPAPVTIHPLDDGVPDELRHRVEIEVRVKRSEGSGPTEEVALQHVLRLGQGGPLHTMELTFEYAPGVADIDGEVQDLEQLARLMVYWRPILRTGDEVIRGDWFSLSGRLEGPSEVAAGERLREGSSLLEGLGGPSDGDAGSSELTAAWLEYRMVVPGRTTRVERREIFDLRAAESNAGGDSVLTLTDRDTLQRGLALLGDTVMVVQAAAVHPSAVIEAYLRDVVDSRPGLIAVAYLAAGRDDERITPSLQVVNPRPLDLLVMLGARGWWSSDPEATFLGRPSIWSRHTLFELTGDGLSGGSAVDIVASEIEVMPGRSVEPVTARIHQGVLDTSIEAVLSGSREPSNTWARFSERASEGTEWLVWRSVSDTSSEAASLLPPGDLARIRASLEAGDIVVVAATPRQRGHEVFADWWRITPDGSTLGVGYKGWGTETTGYSGTWTVADDAVRAFNTQRARSICQRFGLALDGVDQFLIYATLMRADFPKVPLLPSRRAQQACFILR